MIVTLVDGQVIERNLSLLTIAPVGAPANDEGFSSACVMTAVQGFIHPESNGKQMTYIPPSQIKSIIVKKTD